MATGCRTSILGEGIFGDNVQGLLCLIGGGETSFALRKNTYTFFKCTVCKLGSLPKNSGSRIGRKKVHAFAQVFSVCSFRAVWGVIVEPLSGCSPGLLPDELHVALG